ncbi:non-homologous end joining protein Ku [Streptomyces sp. LE64]|uniref:non-homologous end joining protein Ku n=1 Tax=Streptomyces sp. LE64 TaxID=3448653 RepID=UPI0040436A3A
MRSIWNGSLAFGLVNIPVKLMSATESHAVSFRQIHTEDGGRVRYRKVCELEDEEVAAADTVRGYEMPDGTVVAVTDEDLAALPLRTTKTIEVVAVLPTDRIDPLQMDTPYYLSARGPDAAKPYLLLREALRRTDTVALTKFALRGRERLAMLRTVDEVLCLHSLLWPDEIRATDHIAPEGRVTVKDAELDLADALMDTLGEVDPDTMHDEYRAALDELITAKLAGELPAPGRPEEPAGAEVIDLAAILEQSVAAARKKSRSATGKGARESAAKPPAKKAAKKTVKGTTKKTAGKTATGTTAKGATKKAAKKTAKKTAAPRRRSA